MTAEVVHCCWFNPLACQHTALCTCRLQLNSNITYNFGPYTSIPYDSACMGNDYARNVAAPDIDLASLHLYPLVRPHWTEHLQIQVCPADLIADALDAALADAFCSCDCMHRSTHGFLPLGGVREKMTLHYQPLHMCFSQ